MPILSPDSGYLTVLNLFRADSVEKQNLLIGAMRQIVDAASYEGWISSTVHSGQDKIGTANFIQWRNGDGLERRYASDEFKHQIPLFAELTTTIKLLQTEAVFTQRQPSLGEDTVISPDRDDYTVIEIFSTEGENLDDLLTTLGKSQDWLLDTPGYRSHSVLRGKGLRGKYAKPLEGSFAVTYSQWDGKQAYDAFRTLPESEQLFERRSTQARLDSLVTSKDWNTYRVVHSRSASQ
jgi:heme-degrading monooxygenase HmoA